jgi:sortase A
MRKTLLKTISLFLLLLVLILSLFFVLFPNYSAARIQLQQFDTTQVANNTFLNIFSTISYPTILEVTHEQGQEGTLEFLSTQQLEKHQQEYGVVSVEEKKTVLTINSAEIEGMVVDGEDANAMDRGFWYYPLSVPPGKRGNTVIIGHRFLHIPPRKDTFFNLDKVKVGDKIILEQDENIYTYTVVRIALTEKNNTAILEDTNDYRITLITCTPLWTSDERLVIIGKMDKVYGNI